MSFLSLYWLSPFPSVRSLAELGQGLESKFQLQLVAPIGHIYFSRCKWYIYDIDLER